MSAEVKDHRGAFKLWQKAIRGQSPEMKPNVAVNNSDTSSSDARADEPFGCTRGHWDREPREQVGARSGPAGIQVFHPA